MRRSRRFVAALLAVVTLAALATSIRSAPNASALYQQDIGGGDTLVVLSPWETATFYHRFTRHTFAGPQCGVPGMGVVSRVWKIANRLCGARKAAALTQYMRVKWFLYHAMQWGACGAFVVHRNSRGEMSVRPAAAWDGDSYSTLSKLSFGQEAAFKTATGYQRVQCTEFANPSLQSPLARPPRSSPPRRTTPPTAPPNPPPYGGGDFG